MAAAPVAPLPAGILAGHAGAEPPARPGRAGVTPPVAPATLPAGLGDTCAPLFGPELCFGRDCTCSPSPDQQQGMVLDEHSSIPLSQAKTRTSPIPASPTHPKKKKNPRSHFFFPPIPSKKCGLNPTPAEPPLVEQPPQQERIRSCKLRCGWKVFAPFLLVRVLFSPRNQHRNPLQRGEGFFLFIFFFFALVR